MRNKIFFHKDNWDSRYLGFNVIKIDDLDYAGNTSVNINLLLNRIRNKFKNPYILVRVDSRKSNLINYFLKNEFEYLETLAIFMLPQNYICDYKIENIDFAKKKDIPYLIKIAEKSFRYDRFHSDLLINNKIADRIHKLWLLNSFDDKNKKIIVGIKGNIPVGFLVLNTQNNTGVIDLVAVDNRFRNSGMGKMLVRAGISAFSKKVNKITTGTQIANIPAINLYLKTNFLIDKFQITLRSFNK